MPTTEILVLSLKSGVDLNDQDGSAASVVNSNFEELRAVDGVQQVKLGVPLEDPTKLQAMITWDNISNFHTFVGSSAFPPWIKKLGGIVDGKPSIMHVDFEPEDGLGKVLSAPVTEVATMLFDGAPPDDHSDNVAKLEPILGSTEGYLGYALGVSHDAVDKDDVKGKAAVFLVGWQSIESHMAIRQHPQFPESIKTLRSTSKGGSMHHVKFAERVG